MEKQEPIITELNRSLIRFVWKFGPKGLDGECCDLLTLPEFLALEMVSNTAECSIHQAAEPLGFTKSGATRVVNRLEKKGYVRKIRSEKDSRICCVEISDKGEKTLRSVNAHYEKKFSRLVEKLPDYSFNDVAGLIIAMAAEI